jgi:hypothetical protein
MKTNKIKKVLIALDYNPTAQKVAEKGYEMAEAMGAEITLLHVMVNSAMYASAYDTMGIWQIDAINTIETIKILENASHNFLEKAKRHLGNKSIQTIQKEGDFAQQLRKHSTPCVSVGNATSLVRIAKLCCPSENPNCYIVLLPAGFYLLFEFTILFQFYLIITLSKLLICGIRK